MVRVVVKYAATTRALRNVQKNLPGAMAKGMLAHAKFAAKVVQRERFKPYPGPYNEDKGRLFLYKRTGKLQRSVRAMKLGGTAGALVEAGRGLPDNRASLNEFGGTVFGTPFVEIPLPANLTERTGQTKSGARTMAEAIENGARLVGDGDSSVVLGRVGRSNKVQALFVLKASAYVPPRFRFGATILHDRNIVKDRRLRMKRAVLGVIFGEFKKGGFL